MKEFNILTQNVQRYPEMSYSEVKEDIKDSMEWASVIGFQEIEKPYNSILSRIAANNKWEFKMPIPAMGTPMAWDSRVWEFRMGNWFTLHEANERTSTRECTFNILAHRATGARILFNNAHYIPPTRSEYMRIWNEGNAKHREKLQMSWIPRGIPIVGTGDVNRTGKFMGAKAGNYLIQYAFNGEFIDHVWKVNGKQHSLVLTGTEVFKKNSDHKARGATYKIREKR